LSCVINCGDGICDNSGGDDGGNSGGDDGGDNSDGTNEQTHYSRRADLLQKAFLLLP